MNEKTVEALDHVFNVSANTALTAIRPTTEVLPAVMSTEDDDAEQLAKEDFAFSRGALKSIAVETQTSLHRAVEVADQIDKPSAFQAVAEVVRALVETHRELQNMHKTASEIRLANKTAQTPPGTVNIERGVVFNGTPEELLRMISKDRQ